MSIAEESLRLTGLFEAEVLTRLLLWRWDHPLKEDTDFCVDLLENAAGALKSAIAGQQLFDDLPSSETNLIAAIYFAEWAAITSGEPDSDGGRKKWLDQLRAAIPACFHPQDDFMP